MFTSFKRIAPLFHLRQNDDKKSLDKSHAKYSRTPGKRRMQNLWQGGPQKIHDRAHEKCTLGKKERNM